MSEYIDDFSTEIPDDVLGLLYKLGRKYYFDPLSSLESEKYFIELLKKNKENKLENWLEDNVSKDFRYLKNKPEWIQDPEWQFSRGKPMIFVGQINLSPNNTGLHDEAAFYVFWDRELGVTETIIQIS